MKPKEIIDKLSKIIEEHPDVDEIYCMGASDDWYESFSRIIKNIRYEPTLYFDEEAEWAYSEKEEWLEDNLDKTEEDCEKLDWKSAIVIDI